MISDWRKSWAAVGSSPTLPFLFAQVSGWPTADSGMIPVFRVAVEKTLSDLPRVGMVPTENQKPPYCVVQLTIFGPAPRASCTNGKLGRMTEVTAVFFCFA